MPPQNKDNSGRWSNTATAVYPLLSKQLIGCQQAFCLCPGSVITEALYSARGQILSHLPPHSHIYTQPVPIPSACLLLTEELFSRCCSKTRPWPAQSPLLISTNRIIRDGSRFGHSKAKYTSRWAVHQGSYHQGKLVWCSHKIYFC